MQTISFTSIQKAGLLLVVACVFLFAQSAHAQTFTPEQIERVVGMYFKDAPVMVEVARCESGMRQTTDSGNVLRGGAGGMMIGLFQLHEGYHRAPALLMGINIDSLVGNLMYAKHLYQREGTTPWQQCVPAIEQNEEEAEEDVEEPVVKGSAVALANAPARLTQRLTFGARHAEVAQVQRALKAGGYLPVSHASAQFDIPTMRALVRFQCEEGITCGAGSSFAEYGAVGEKTRTLLNEVLLSEA